MNKLGQGLAVGLTAIACAVVAAIGVIHTNNGECLLVMGVPVAVAIAIMIGDGWE